MTYVTGGHPVEKEQWEPNIADEAQAHHHHVDVVISSWQLNSTFGLHRRFGIEFSLPFRANIVTAEFDDAQGQKIDGYESIHHRNESIAGLGDIVLGARIAVIRPMDVAGLTMDITVGTSIPTGGTEADPFALGKQGKEHQHMFFGSGIFMPRFGLEIGYGLSDFSLSGWAQSKAAFLENSEGYQPSSSISGGLGISSAFGLKKWRFMVQQGVFYESEAEWGGKRAENSGRTDLLAGLGVIYTPDPQWGLNLGAQVPWMSFTDGAQFSVPVIVTLGARYKVDLLN
jgi:hypothetical protein